MSEIKVNKISPRTACGTTTLGDSGDTFTIPSGVTISNLGTAAGFGGTGEISWDTTVKTTGTFTATSGVGYFLNTTGGTITVNLPAGSAGDSVALADYAATWASDNVTLTPNGTDNLGGANTSATLNTNGQSVTFVYVDAVQGWVNVLDSTSNVRGEAYVIATGGCITTSGDYKVHTFNGPGSFQVTQTAAIAADNMVSYMIVGGGAGTGAGDYAGGGGAGGFRELKSPPAGPYTASPLDGYCTAPNRITVSATTYPIIVGAGGGGGAYPDGRGDAGGVSTFDSITSAGGGGGGEYSGGPNCGLPGGSGGGGSANAGPAGAGNSPSTTPSQGFPGGVGSGTSGGGGGGALAAGATGAGSCAGSAGGAGATTCISFSPVTKSTGGQGGGSALPASNGACNSGDGGYRANPGTAGNGGSGVVVIRYKYQ